MDHRFTTMIFALSIVMIFGMFYIGYTMGYEHGEKKGYEKGASDNYIDIEQIFSNPDYIKHLFVLKPIKVLDEEYVEYTIDNYNVTNTIVKISLVPNSNKERPVYIYYNVPEKDLYVYYDENDLKNCF